MMAHSVAVTMADKELSHNPRVANANAIAYIPKLVMSEERKGGF